MCGPSCGSQPIMRDIMLFAVKESVAQPYRYLFHFLGRHWQRDISLGLFPAKSFLTNGHDGTSWLQGQVPCMFTRMNLVHRKLAKSTGQLQSVIFSSFSFPTRMRCSYDGTDKHSLEGQVIKTCPLNSSWFKFMRQIAGAKCGPLWLARLSKRCVLQTPQLRCGTCYRDLSLVSSVNL